MHERLSAVVSSFFLPSLPSPPSNQIFVVLLNVFLASFFFLSSVVRPPPGFCLCICLAGDAFYQETQGETRGEGTHTRADRCGGVWTSWRSRIIASAWLVIEWKDGVRILYNVVCPARLGRLDGVAIVALPQ